MVAVGTPVEMQGDELAAGADGGRDHPVVGAGRQRERRELFLQVVETVAEPLVLPVHLVESRAQRLVGVSVRGLCHRPPSPKLTVGQGRPYRPTQVDGVR